jgi:hypothetical protein
MGSRGKSKRQSGGTKRASERAATAGGPSKSDVDGGEQSTTPRTADPHRPGVPSSVLCSIAVLSGKWRDNRDKMTGEISLLHAGKYIYKCSQGVCPLGITAHGWIRSYVQIFCNTPHCTPAVTVSVTRATTRTRAAPSFRCPHLSRSVCSHHLTPILASHHLHGFTVFASAAVTHGTRVLLTLAYTIPPPPG